MSEKRTENVYHDPDYKQFQATTSSIESDQNQSQISQSTKKENRTETICRIVEREFQQELTNKEEELQEINRRIDEAKELLAKVRYVVVHHYYNRKSLMYSDEEIAAVQKSQQESMTNYPPPGDKPQLAIHPSLKKLLGKRPIDYNEILKSRPTRKAAQNATEQFHKLTKKPADTRIKLNEPIIADDRPPDGECKKPRYVAPSSSKQNIEQMNSARGRHSYRHLIAVGNISKYIGDEEVGLATNVTHKWLIYITAKTPVPVDQIVNRARFFLHESYKPNDVIEVSAPPFQITKRGWGEFPVRVQIYFHPYLMQKPVQIFHTLVLDKKHTGMQTMGAETIVELWLNTPNTIESDDTETDEPPAKKERPNEVCESKPSTNSIVDPIPDPMPSTSSQSIPTPIEHPQNPSSSCEISIKQEPLNVQMPVPETLISTEPPIKIENSQHYGATSALASVPLSVPIPSVNTVNIKMEHPSPLPVIPEFKICDLNNANISSQIGNPQVKVVMPASKEPPKKRFIKCVSKDGRVSLMELIQDEKNPKLYKMVLPQPVQGSTIVLPPAANRMATPIVLNPPNLVRPAANLVVQPNSLVPPNIGNINLPSRALPVGSIRPVIVLNRPNQPMNKTNATLNRSNGTSISVELPKLVAIDSPRPQPTVVTQQPRPVVLPAPIRPSTAIIPCKPTQIIQKNNKVLVLDSNQPSRTQPKSLLKPGVSLLKPRPQSTSNNLKKIIVNNIPGIEHKNINVFVPADVKLELNTAIKSTTFEDALEKRFLDLRIFSNVSDAVAWLMKEIPLVTSMASQRGYRESFPFAMSTLAEFQSLHLAKQRSFEWLRAKHINRLIAKHSTINAMPKWSTRETVLYGRWFGYTPRSVFSHLNSGVKDGSSQNVRDIVKSELMREHLESDVISFNRKLVKWIDEWDSNGVNGLKQATNEPIIVVDELDDDKTEAKHANASTSDNKLVQLPIQKGIDEIMWINDTCRKMQIRFDEEEIASGVVHRSAEVVLSTALRSFVEDLLRKCSANKFRTNSNSSNTMEINNDDVLRTISTIQRFDFLTNKNFGINKTNLS